MYSPKVLTLVGFVSAAVAGLAVSMPASAGTCFDFWVERNAIYDANGYCFKTSKAADYFGNTGCIYNNAAAVPMSASEKRRVLALKRREKQLGCL